MKPEWRPISLTRPDAVARARGLHVGAADHLDGGRERALEPEAPIDEMDVVVDGLRDADDGDLQPAPLHLGDDGLRPAQRAVAADHEEHVDAQRSSLSTMSPGS